MLIKGSYVVSNIKVKNKQFRGKNLDLLANQSVCMIQSVGTYTAEKMINL